MFFRGSNHPVILSIDPNFPDRLTHTKIPLNILCNTFSSWKVSPKLKFRKKADQKEMAGLGALLCLTGVSKLPILEESNNTHVW